MKDEFFGPHTRILLINDRELWLNTKFIAIMEIKKSESKSIISFSSCSVIISFVGSSSGCVADIDGLLVNSDFTSSDTSSWSSGIFTVLMAPCRASYKPSITAF